MVRGVAPSPVDARDEGQIRAANSVNRELILLYWDIGKAIVERQKNTQVGRPGYGPSLP
jgi:hypothetical protein